MMANMPNNRHAVFAASYDFSGAGLIADIGGGNGAALRHILARFPNARGLIYDRDDVIEALTSADLMQGRIGATSGSFFDRAPRGADVYMLIKVLHDWADEDCIEILRVCRAAIEPRSFLLIGEQILANNSDDGEATAYLIDTQMMAMFGHARERTESDFRELLDKASFELRRVIPTDSPISILEAVPKETASRE